MALKFADGFAELLTLLGVFRGGFVCALRHAECQRSNGDAAAVENLQAVDEAFAFVRPASFRAGMRQSLKITSDVSLARMPSLFSFFPGRKPGVPFSIMNAEIPWDSFDLSVTAMATQTSA